MPSAAPGALILGNRLRRRLFGSSRLPEFLNLFEGGWPIGLAGHASWYPTSYVAPASFEGMLTELGLNASQVIDNRDYATLDLAVAASLAAQKPLLVAPGTYTVSSTRKYGARSIYGYGATKPVVSVAGRVVSTVDPVTGQNGTITRGAPTWHLYKHDYTSSWIRYENHGIILGMTRPILPTSRDGGAPSIFSYYGQANPVLPPVNDIHGGTSASAEAFPTLQIARIMVTAGGTGSLNSINTQRQLSGTASGYMADDTAHMARMDPAAPNILGAAVNYTSKTAPEIAQLIAAQITAVSIEGITAEAIGSEVRIFKPTFRGDFWRLLLDVTGTATMEHVTCLPDVCYRACEFYNVDLAGLCVSSEIGVGHLKYLENDFNASWGGFYNMAPRIWKLWETRNYWHDCTGTRMLPKNDYGHYNTMFSCRFDSPVQLREIRFYGTEVKSSNSEALDVQSIQSKDTANGAVFFDGRGLDRDWTHNEFCYHKFVRLGSTTGHEDTQPMYFKVQGGLHIHDIYMEACGSYYKSGPVNSTDPITGAKPDDGNTPNGSEFSGIGIKDEPEFIDMTAENRLYNLHFKDMPGGIPIMKMDNQRNTNRLWNILIENWKNYRGDTQATNYSLSGAMRFIERMGNYKINSVHFKNTTGVDPRGLGINVHNNTNVTGTSAAEWELTNITAYNDGSEEYPAFTGDIVYGRVDSPLGGSTFFTSSTSTGAVFGHNDVFDADGVAVGRILFMRGTNGGNYPGVKVGPLKPYEPPTVAQDYRLMGNGPGRALGSGRGRVLAMGTA